MSMFFVDSPDKVGASRQSRALSTMTIRDGRERQLLAGRDARRADRSNEWDA
jgi:hypothetical protein